MLNRDEFNISRKLIQCTALAGTDFTIEEFSVLGDLYHLGLVRSNNSHSMYERMFYPTQELSQAVEETVDSLFNDYEAVSHYA